MDMDIAGLQAFRKEKNDFFRTSHHSPLTPAQRKVFSGLAYYDPNPALVLEVTLDVFEKQEQFLMQTNRDELRPFVKYGRFTFEVDGQAAQLTVYRSDRGHFFLPFVDANAGSETYESGRYLDLEESDDGTFVVDFNIAYNPYCAYNDLYVCPITPKENRLTVAIRAGEKSPQGDWVSHG